MTRHKTSCLSESEAETSTDIIQNLTFQLRHDLEDEDEADRPMATVCQVNRAHHTAQHFNTVQDWFQYAFSTREIKGSVIFPTLNFTMYVDAVQKISSCFDNIIVFSPCKTMLWIIVSFKIDLICAYSRHF